MNNFLTIKLHFYKFRRSIIKSLKFIVFKGNKKYDLLMYDDIFPHTMSGFRLEEYTFLLNNISNSKIIIDGEAYKFLNSPNSKHKEDVVNLVDNNPEFKSRLIFKNRFLNINTNLFYCVFLNNIFKFLPYLEKHRIPFFFTLYPGGGFKVNDELIDAKISRVLSSNMFRGVFTTQKITSEYLLRKNFCSEEKIHLIFGCVVPQVSLKRSFISKEYFSIDKKVFNICFCAVKYSTYGEDKGYDIFINVAHKLIEEFSFVKIHIIGGFDENTIPINKNINNITFYGYQDFANLSNIFQKMDIILSPNRPFYLNDGEFDGFPLGTVVEAVLNGVVALLSDELNQNKVFVDFEDLIIVKNKEEDIIKNIKYLIKNPLILKAISISGKKKFQRIYSNEIQMKPRIETLKKIIFNE